MAPLHVEYAKSARAKCGLTSCKKAIAKNEVRIGTAIVLPFGDDGAESIKWRHLCCFTDRQLVNAKASGDIDNIVGYDNLAPADKALVEQMKRGELISKEALIGRVGDIMNSPLAAELAGKPAKGKGKVAVAGEAPVAAKPPAAAKAPPKKRAAKKVAPAAVAEDSVDSDATDEYDVEVRDVSSKPKCPYGALCFRTALDHFSTFSHDEVPADASPGPTAKRPVITGKKRARNGSEDGRDSK